MLTRLLEVRWMIPESEGCNGEEEYCTATEDNMEIGIAYPCALYGQEGRKEVPDC